MMALQQPISFEDLVAAVQALPQAQKSALIYTLNAGEPFEDEDLTRERALAELEVLRASGAFENVESLQGKYARPFVDVSDEQLRAFLRQIGKGWEEELDELGYA